MGTITKVPQNLKDFKAPLLMVVFLAFFGVIFGTQSSYGRAQDGIVSGILGGPVTPSVEKLPVASSREQGMALFPEADVSAVPLGNSDPFLGLAQANTALFPAGVEMISTTYSVKKKDTLIGIAKTLGVSQRDLLDANPILKGGRSKLKVGDVLALAIPVKSPENQNAAIETSLAQGTDTSAHSGILTLAESKAYFKTPADGFNWGKLHNYDAVDIANVCGTPIVAPADGIVVNDENFGDGSSDWNGGYGHFVLLEHPNGTKTRMAHLDAISVSIGDMVKKGQQLGTMGQTGDATGCHVHFEVIGAPNPFVKS
jgi:murein DD-endopeptidase MepM/ murein hydrolase activator NlpD